ncbi:hypothetical protein [Methylobacterium sp. CM6244]
MPLTALHPTLNTPTAAVSLTIAQMSLTADALRTAGYYDLAEQIDREVFGYGPTGTLVLRGGWTAWGYDPQDGEPEGVGAQPTREDDLDLIRPGVRIIVRNASAFEVTRLVRNTRAATAA